jgi:membrane fusion protein, multidrug efflux system
MKFFAKSEIGTLALGGVVVVALAGAAWWALSGGTGASAQSNAPRERVVAVAVGKAMRKDVPYRIDAPGAVQPMVSVTVRARVDSQVERVAFQDGAAVKEGDVLFKLDARAIDAQIRQAEGQLTRDQASVVKAKRDVERYAGLVGKGSISQVQLDDARTNADVLEATVKQDEANLDNLRAQRSYYDVLSPATGRVGVPGVRTGAVVKSGDMLATVNQMSPIYIAFGVPERYIPDLRAAGANAKVDGTLQNGVKASGGSVAFIDNTVDPTTGTIMVRALFDNKDERLWPGTLASVRLALRIDPNVVTVPNEAVQRGQRGNFVFVVENNVARVRQIAVTRTIEGEAVIADGLNGGETVVTDGQVALRDGSRVDIKRAPGA